MSDELVLVDLKDRTIGSGEKLWVHQNDKLHRAFSVFVVDGNKMLLQKRNILKYHSGGLWANACCSHPRKGEELRTAVKRRMLEEIGVSAEFKEIFSFIYRSEYNNKLTEYEFDHVFICNYSGDVWPDKSEIDKINWVDIDWLKKDVVSNPSSYASWFLIALPRVLEYLEK